MREMLRAREVSWCAFIVLCLLTTTACQTSMDVSTDQPQSSGVPTPLPDLSGLVWVRDDLFLAVHDAKTRKEANLPRISLLTLPSSSKGVLWRPVDVVFPGEESNDLESAARIPGTTQILLAESGDNAGPFNRIFLVDVRDDAVEAVGMTRWSTFTKPYNVEATAVAKAGPEGRLFIWAERNSGNASTDLKWAKLSLDPLSIGGPIGSIPFTLPEDAYDAHGSPLYSRPLVAIDIDSKGHIYVAAALDPEEISDTPDNGPFRSIIYKIGSINGDRIVLDPNPRVIAMLDGVKVESLAVREHQGRQEIFVGTDDENYGGILRVLPMRREGAD